MTGFGPVQPKVCGTGRVESPGKVPIPLSSKYTCPRPAANGLAAGLGVVIKANLILKGR